MNGLESARPESAEYRRIDASSPEGKAIYRSYGLRGHPAIIILDTSGEPLWIGIGETPLEELKNRIDEAIIE